jgi:homoserine kinase
MARTPAPELRACAVRVPCSTSNLGAGFDCLGLAFDRYIDAGFEPGGDTLHV